MKKNYVITIVAIVAVIMLFFGFKEKDQKFDGFIEIYNTKEYTISVKKQSDSKAWMKQQYTSKKVKAKNGKYVTLGGNMKLSLWECSCYSRQYSISKMLEYDRKGDVIRSSSMVAFQEPVVPGTIGELIFEHICRNNDESYFNNYSVSDSAAWAVDSAALVDSAAYSY